MKHTDLQKQIAVETFEKMVDRGYRTFDHNGYLKCIYPFFIRLNYSSEQRGVHARAIVDLVNRDFENRAKKYLEKHPKQGVLNI